MIRRSGACVTAWLSAVCLLTSVGLLGAAVPAQAQVRVSGKTMSDTSAPVAAAEVVVRTPASDVVVGARRATLRARSCSRSPPPAPTGSASSTRASTPSRHQEVTLEPGADLVLTLFPVREHLESLDVTSRGDPASISQPSAEQSLSGAEAMNVPFNGSHGVKNALRTLPGVVQDGSGGIHVDGARESQTLFILDGFNVGDPLNGGFDPKVSVEAVQALTVRNGVYAAEFGKGSGGVIEVATHVGGDRLRYSATDFFPTIVREKGLRIQDWTPRLSMSGPLARGRAWFSDSFIGEYDQSFVEELPEGRGFEHQPAPEQPPARAGQPHRQERAPRRRGRQRRPRPPPRPRPARSDLDHPRREIAPMVRQRPRSARLRQRRGAGGGLRRQPYGAPPDPARPRGLRQHAGRTQRQLLLRRPPGRDPRSDHRQRLHPAADVAGHAPDQGRHRPQSRRLPAGRRARPHRAVRQGRSADPIDRVSGQRPAREDRRRARRVRPGRLDDPSADRRPRRRPRRLGFADARYDPLTAGDGGLDADRRAQAVGRLRRDA